jgi:hypothetical protein
MNEGGAGMAIHMFGGSPPLGPFNRTFFNVTLGDVFERSSTDTGTKLLLYLGDGTTLDVCAIDEITEDYLAVRAYRQEGDACDLSVHLIPYTLIYRIELTPKDAENTSRLGFRWTPPSRRGTGVRKPKESKS